MVGWTRSVSAPRELNTCYMLLEPPQQLDEADVATARRLYAERGGPPSDAPQAVAILKTEKALAWRYRPPGSSIDVYASEFVVPVAPETFVAMSTSVDRLSWDDNCKALETLATAPPAELARLHRQPGDAMILFWSVAMPFPLKAREYVLRRALRRLPPAAPGEPVIYAFADRALGEDQTYKHKARRSGDRVTRVTEYWQLNCAWAEGEGTTRVRALCAPPRPLEPQTWVRSLDGPGWQVRQLPYREPCASAGAAPPLHRLRGSDDAATVMARHLRHHKAAAEWHRRAQKGGDEVRGSVGAHAATNAFGDGGDG